MSLLHKRKCRINFYLIGVLIIFHSLVTIEASEQNIGTPLFFSLGRDSEIAPTDSNSLSNTNYTPGELIVRLNQKNTFDQLHTFSEKIGAVSVLPIFLPNTPAGQHPSLNRTYLVRFPTDAQLAQLKQKFIQNGSIEAVEMNRLNRFCAETIPNDPKYDEQWNLMAMNLQKAWNIEKGKPTVIVAVIDSGIIKEHVEFRNQLWLNIGEVPGNGIDDDSNGYVDDIEGWDFTDAPTLPGHGDWTERDNQPNDETGHGTHVSGIIAAEADNGIGIAGIAWHCRLMPLRAGFRVGAGSFLQNDDVAAAIVYAADNGAHVINLSLGDTVNSFLMKDAVEYAYHRGCLLVAAAGNSSEPGAYYPAALNKVISVAALDRSFQLGGTNFGASIDIAAPGEDILSTFLIDPSLLDPGYISLSGTSMAAAHVSGVAALLFSANPSCSNVEMKHVLTATARKLSITQIVGAGLIDAWTALTEPIGLTAYLSKTSIQMDHNLLDCTDKITETSQNVDIFGSAGGTAFAQYRLEYGQSETPELWFPIGFPQTEPKYNTVLHNWDTSQLEEGIYTLRLSVKGENGKTVRDKIVVEIRRTLPKIFEHEASVWLSENRFDPTIIWQTDVLTTGSIEIFQKTDIGSEISDYPYHNLLDCGTPSRVAFSDSVNRQHIVSLSELGLEIDEYFYRLKSENRAGLIRTDDNNGELYTIVGHREQIQPHHLLPITSSQFGLHAATIPNDINANGKLELVGTEISVSGHQSTHFLELDGDGNLIVIDSLSPSISISRLWATADTDGDGLIELLCNVADKTFLLEQPEHGQYPTKEIWRLDGIWGGTIADIDLDGKPEIYSRHDNSNTIWVHESNENNRYMNITKLENPTQGKNLVGTRFATGDFDADGHIEIVAGDNDGELFIYENVANNAYHQTWIGALPDGVPYLFAAGDMNGDAIPEFAVGAKVWTTEFDLPRQHWLWTIYSSDGNNSYQIVWQQRIRQLRDEESGAIIADANSDGKNELCIAASPNFYLIQNDGISFRPIWHQAANSTFNPIVADIDNNGINELLFNTDDGLTIFNNPDTTGSGKRLVPPWGISAKPIDETSISLEWQSEPNVVAYTIYRGQSKSSLKPIAKEVKEKLWTDIRLSTGQTYWYAITAHGSNGEVSGRSLPVSVAPNAPPKLVSATHSPPHQLILTFSKQMNSTAANASRYKLHEDAQTEKLMLQETTNDDEIQKDLRSSENSTPQSAILDRSGKRVVLTFSDKVFNRDKNYRIEAVQLSDIYGAEIPAGENMLTVEFPAEIGTEVIVYPNPVRENQVTFDKLPAASRINIYDVAGNSIASLIPNNDNNIGDRCKIVWSLDGISNGVYIYVLQTGITQQIGKFSVIR